MSKVALPRGNSYNTAPSSANLTGENDQRSHLSSSTTTTSLPVKKKNFLQSHRFDAMYISNTSWDFFDAYNQSRPSQLAFNQEEISFDHLDKYLTMTYDANIEEYRNATRVITRPLPPLIAKLITLQSKNGKFESLDNVLALFHIPKDLPFIKCRHRAYADWEKATAYAIAAMRQEIEYFEELFEYHNLAEKWVQSGELISDARENFSRYRGTAAPSPSSSSTGQFHYLPTSASAPILDHTQALSGSGIAKVEEEEERSTMSGMVSMLTDGTVVSSEKAKKQDKRETRRRKNQLKQDEKGNLPQEPEQNNDEGSNTKEEESNEEQEDEIDDENDFSTILSKELPALTELQDSSVKPDSPSNDRLKTMLKQLTNEMDHIKIKQQTEKIEQLETSIVNLCMHIEELVRQISFCLDRCVEAYNMAELTNERYRTFDEITARLGEGFAPSVAYDDWRRQGCEGIRPSILKFFNQIQQLAEERVYLAELYLPDGRDWKSSNNKENNRSKWILLWNGHNIVLKVIHCLDFLRKCRELSDWYGPAYFFVANPLQLPFALWKAFDKMSLQEKIEDQLQTQPHGRVGIMNLYTKKEWQHVQYLNEFRRKFLELCRDWSFNWPSVPNMREDELNEQYFHAFLVLFITCSETIEKSYQWEKKFISTISTLRGQQKNLVGKGNQKVLKELKLPTLEQRQARQNVGIAELLITLPVNDAPRKGVFFNPNANRQPKTSMLMKKKSTIILLEKQKQLEKSLFTIEKAERKESVLPNVDVTSMLRPSLMTSLNIAARKSSTTGAGRQRTSTIAIKRSPTKIGRASLIQSPNRQSTRLTQRRPTSSPAKAPSSLITDEKSGSLQEGSSQTKGEDSTIIDDPNNSLKKINQQNAKKFLQLVNNKNAITSQQSPLRSSTVSPATGRKSTLIGGMRSSLMSPNNQSPSRMSQRMSNASQLPHRPTFSPNQQSRLSTTVPAIPERSRLNIHTNSIALSGGSASLVLSEQPSDSTQSPKKRGASTIRPSFPLFASKSSSLLNRSESVALPSPNSKARKPTIVDSPGLSTSEGDNNNSDKETSVVKNDAPRPSTVVKKKKSILKREDLAKEIIQSRKVSRLQPMTTDNQNSNSNNEKDNTNTTNSVPQQPRLTKRRSTNQSNQKIL